MRKIAILDYILLAGIVSIITLQPYYIHGAINFYETGIYLPQINELFSGKVLYRDIFVLRGPLEILIPAIFMKLFGMHIGILNAYFYFGTIITLIIYAFFALLLFRTRLFSYLFTLVLMARTFPWSCFSIWGGIRFGFSALALLFAVNFLKKNKKYWLFLAGMLTSSALWTSFELGVFSFSSIFVMLILYGCFEQNDPKQVFKYISIYVIGNIVLSAPNLFYLFLNNAFVSYVDTIRIVLCNTIKVFDPSLCFETPRNIKEFLLAFSPLSHNFRYTLPFLFYVLVAIYLLRNLIKKKFSVRDISIIPIAIYGMFLYKGVFRNVEGPQYRMVLQPLLLIMFFYLEDIYIYVKNIKPAPGFKKLLIVFFLILVPLYSIIFSVHKYNRRFFIFKEIKSLLLDKRHEPIPYTDPNPTAIKAERAKGIIVPYTQAEEIDGVVNYITSHTKEREIVFTFPNLGAYNFLTDRPQLGRFYIVEFAFMDEKWHRELMDDLKTKMPNYVICTNDFKRLEPFRPTLGKYLDEVNEFLTKNYKVVAEYSAVNILRLK